VKGKINDVVLFSSRGGITMKYTIKGTGKDDRPPFPPGKERERRYSLWRRLNGIFISCSKFKGKRGKETFRVKWGRRECSTKEGGAVYRCREL